MQVILEELSIMISIPSFEEMITVERNSKGPDW